VINITYWQRLFNQTILSVLHARVVTAPTTGSTAEIQLQDLADTKLSVSASFPLYQKLKAAAASNFAFDRVTVQKVKPTRTIYVQSSLAAFGDQTTAASTANLAASIEKQTTVTGKTGIGRLQFGGMPSDKIVSGVIDADYFAVEMEGIALNMYGNFSGGTTHGGVYAWCLPAGGADRGYDLWNAFPQRTVRTMHRRTVGLGI